MPDTTNKLIRSENLREAIAQYLAYRNLRLATEAERALLQLKILECEALLKELDDDAG